MARVVFTQQLRRFTQTPEVQTDAATLREALEAAFAVNPRLRGYVLDHLRVNVVAFIATAGAAWSAPGSTMS
mgnify:CR=1 FL=1